MVILLSQYMSSNHGFSLPKKLKDSLGSNVRVGYYIPVPDFYLVLHGLRLQKTLYWINHQKCIYLHIVVKRCTRICRSAFKP